MTAYKSTKTIIVSNKMKYTHNLITILVKSSRAERLISGVLLHCRLGPASKRLEIRSTGAVTVVPVGVPKW